MKLTDDQLLIVLHTVPTLDNRSAENVVAYVEQAMDVIGSFESSLANAIRVLQHPAHDRSLRLRCAPFEYFAILKAVQDHTNCTTETAHQALDKNNTLTQAVAWVLGGAK